MKLHKLLLVITLAILALESIADTPSGTDYVTFWSGDMRIYSQQPNTEVTLIDIDTGLTLNMLADPRISWANINGTSSNSNPFTLSTAGDQWRGRGGIGAPTQEIRVRILSDAPVTVWTGSNLSGSNAWGSMIPSSVSSTASFGSEVGRSFTGFVDKEMVIVAPVGSGSSPTEIAINNLTLGSSETLILNASVPNCPPFPAPAPARCYMVNNSEVQVIYANGFTDSRVVVTSTVDASVLVGRNIFSRSNWSYTPPSFASGDEGSELGTEFYFVSTDSITIFPTQDDTNVSITDLSDGDDSVFVTLANGQPGGAILDIYSVRTTAMVTRAAGPQVNLLSNGGNHIDDDVIKVTSDKPIIIYVGPPRDDPAEMADVAFSVPTGTDSRVVYAFAQNYGSSNDLQLFAFQRDTQVTITSLSASRGSKAKHDFAIDFDVLPGTNPQVSVNGGAFGSCPNNASATCTAKATPGDIQHFGSGLWLGELVRIESNKPVTVISGDIDGSNFGAFIPYVSTSSTLPPVAVIAPQSTEVCIGDPVTFDGTASFDQDSIGAAPSITTYDWDFGDASPPGSGSSTNHSYSSGGTYNVTLTVTDNETQTDDGSATVTVRPPNHPECNQPPVAVCIGLDVSANESCEAEASIDNGSFDPDGDDLDLSQDPPGPYALGNNLITLTVTEIGAEPVLSDTCVATIKVIDDTDPAVDAGIDQLLEATSINGAPATLSISSSDACGQPTINVNPVLVIYPLGTTTVTVTATDGSNNDASDTVDIKVMDTTPPVLTIPDDIEVEATGPQTPVSIGSASATDIFPVTITNNAPADYPVGSTPVVWIAIDENNNSTSLTQTITVVDTTPPVVTPPADLVVVSTGLLTPADLGIATATDLVGVVSGPTPDLPGPFLAGTTTIIWSASDAAGNVGTAIQTITVLGQLVCEMEVDDGNKSKKSGKSGKSDKSGKSEKTPGIRLADSMHLETYNSDENIDTLWDSLFAATPGINETVTMQTDNVLTWQAGEIELSGQIGLAVSSGKKSDKSGKRSGKRSGKGSKKGGTPPSVTGPVLKKITLTDAKKKQGTTDFVSSSGGVNVNLADGGWHDVMVKGMDGVEVIIDGVSVTGHLKQLKLQLDKSSTVATPEVKDFRLVLSGMTEIADVKKGLAGSVVVKVPATVVTALGSTVYDEESKDGPAVLGGHTEAEFDSTGGLIGVDISSLLDGSNDNLHQRKGACVVNVPNHYEGGEGEDELPDDGEGEGDGPLPDNPTPGI